MNWKKWLVFLAVPLAVGGVSALLTRDGMEMFQSLNKPPGSPPAWLFPVVWSVLFLLMGIASGLAAQADGPENAVHTALTAYGAQLIVNFFWPVIFFGLQYFLPAFFWLILLWVLVLLTLVLFWNVNRPAGLLLIPYLLRVTYAGYLNFGVWRLN